MKMGKWKKIKAKKEPYVLISVAQVSYGCLPFVFSYMLIHSMSL